MKMAVKQCKERIYKEAVLYDVRSVCQVFLNGSEVVGEHALCSSA